MQAGVGFRFSFFHVDQITRQERKFICYMLLYATSLHVIRDKFAMFLSRRAACYTRRVCDVLPDFFLRDLFWFVQRFAEDLLDLAFQRTVMDSFLREKRL